MEKTFPLDHKIDLEKEIFTNFQNITQKDKVVTRCPPQKANKYAGGTITYDFDYTTETLDYETSKDWVKISKDFKVTLDESKVGDYIENSAPNTIQWDPPVLSLPLTALRSMYTAVTTAGRFIFDKEKTQTYQRNQVR